MTTTEETRITTYIYGYTTRDIHLSLNIREKISMKIAMPTSKEKWYMIRIDDHNDESHLKSIFG